MFFESYLLIILEWINLISEKEKKTVLILDGFDKLDCESML